MAQSLIKARLFGAQLSPHVTRYQITNSPRRRNASFPMASSLIETRHREITIPKPLKDMPGPKGIYRLPVIGIALHMKPFGKYTPQTFPYLIANMVERYGPIFRMQTTETTVVITDPRDFITVVNNESRYPARPPIGIFKVYSERNGRSDNVTHLQGEEWYRLRQLMRNTMMAQDVLNRYLPEMNKVSDEFVRILSDGYLKDHDAEEAFMAFATEVIGELSFHRRLGMLDVNDKCQEVNEFRSALKDLMDVTYNTMTGSSIAFRFYRSKDYRKFESAHNLVSKKLMDFIQEASKKDPSVIGENDLLHIILKKANKQDAVLIMEATFFAAIQSSAAAIQTVLYTLANNQEKQDRLRKEIRNVLGSHDKGNEKYVSKEDLENMHYLKACVNEVYRVTSIGPFGMARVLPVEVNLSGYKVPAGVSILTHNMKSCKDPALFENPEKFEPERWIRQDIQDTMTMDKSNNSRNALRTCAMIPFGMGARSCPGKNIFEQELYLIVCKLVRNLRIGLEPDSRNMEFDYRPFRKSVKPIRFTFTAVK